MLASLESYIRRLLHAANSMKYCKETLNKIRETDNGFPEIISILDLVILSGDPDAQNV